METVEVPSLVYSYARALQSEEVEHIYAFNEKGFPVANNVGEKYIVHIPQTMLSHTSTYPYILHNHTTDLTPLWSKSDLINLVKRARGGIAILSTKKDIRAWRVNSYFKYQITGVHERVLKTCAKLGHPIYYAHTYKKFNKMLEKMGFIVPIKIEGSESITENWR